MRRAILSAALIVLSLCLASAPAAAALEADGIVHVVQPGENLFRIGLKYGVSWSAIMQANGLASTYIYAGQQLVIPASGLAEPSVTFDNPASYTVVRGDTLATIAQRYGVTVDSLAAANSLPANRWVYAGQTLTIPGAGPVQAAPAPAAVELEAAPVPEQPGTFGAYVVQRGDTLAAIAQRHGLTIAALATANQLPSTGWLYAGQTLVIPAGGEKSLAPAPASEPTPAAGGAYAKSILVDISDQRLHAYQDGALLYDFVASTGSPGLDTRPGTYSVLNKIPNAYGGTWNIWMPHWLGIYWAGSLQNGIHSLPILPGGGRLWEGWLGTPVSYGCVILGIWEAEMLYTWAEVGTPVVIQW